MRGAGYGVYQIGVDDACRHGHFVPPTMIEMPDLSELTHEVFGPVLHVLRYRRENLDALVEKINGTGYGLTFGIHSRIDETIDRLIGGIHAGNLYVNRNIVGAVVGVQPFGGEKLSGTGPKAGGPLYLHRLVRNRMTALPAWSRFDGHWPVSIDLPGPTGESNVYTLRPRGVVLCIPQTLAGLRAQWDAVQKTANRALLPDTPQNRQWASEIGLPASSHDFVADAALDEAAFDAVLFEGDGDALQTLAQRVAARPGAIASVQGLTPDAVAGGQGYGIDRLLAERSVSINTAAAGGNAKLMSIG
jgi:RHH-type proline utilization regulon transcriptional repressor/proline dehydrogenase/delta 1-pyrroline-5-carboxylate dehydrogenase